MAIPTRHRSAITAALPLALLACSTGGQHLTHSGFLSDYDRLARPAKHKNAAIWVSPGYRPDRYQTVVVAPVEWRTKARDAAIQGKLQQQLHDRLVASLSRRFRVVARGDAAPGTLEVRSAITGMRRTRWYLNAPLQAAQFATGGIGLFAPLQGGASVEFKIVDMTTGQSQVELASYRNGRPWDFKGSYVAYDHARGAFGNAADFLAHLLAEPAYGSRLPEDAAKRQKR